MAAAKNKAPDRRPLQDRKRRSEIEWRLAEAGLKAGPRRSRRDAGWDDTRSRRLAQVLPELGPVFAGYGLYLSSRVDLLPPADCLELAGIRDVAPPMPTQEVERIVHDDLGSRIDEAGLQIGPQPLESRLFFQVHPAGLGDGRQATVRVVRPALQSWIERDARHLSLLQGTLGKDVPLQEAAQDFSALVRRIDLNEEAEMQRTLGQGDDLHLPAFPVPLSGLCSPRVLAAEQLPGERLDRILEALQATPSPARLELPGGHAITADELARYLCLAWLRLALLEAAFPRRVRAESIWVLEDRRIAFTEGTFAALSTASQENLLQHLQASAKRDPIASCSSISKELEPPTARSESQPDLELWFRQIAPFRDGGWDLHSSGDSTAEYLFAQWRSARRHGFRPRRHLVPFFQGLFEAASLARRLAPGRDTVKEALDDLRVSVEMARFRKMMTAGNWTENLDRYAALMMELPQKLDDVLNRAAAGKPVLRVELEQQDAQQHKRKNSLFASAALLLLLVAVVLLSRQMPQWTGGAAWAEQVSALIVLLLGGMLLWKAARD